MVSSKHFERSKKKRAGDSEDQPQREGNTSGKKKRRRNDKASAKDYNHRQQEPNRNARFIRSDVDHFKKRRKSPSPDALRLSEKLKILSRNKNLNAALELYRDKSNDSIRDGHHAGIVIDCCARCGNVSVRILSPCDTMLIIVAPPAVSL